MKFLLKLIRLRFGRCIDKKFCCWEYYKNNYFEDKTFSSSYRKCKRCSACQEKFLGGSSDSRWRGTYPAARLPVVTASDSVEAVPMVQVQEKIKSCRFLDDEWQVTKEE